MGLTQKHYATMKREWLRFFGEHGTTNYRPEQFLSGPLAGNGETYQNQLTGSSQRQARANGDRIKGYHTSIVIHALGRGYWKIRKKG